jgi:hypothetical protein
MEHMVQNLEQKCGSSFKYIEQYPAHRIPDGRVVYSVGVDEKDDDGDVLPSEGHGTTDLGIRLWNLDQRRKPARKLDNQ